MKIGFAVCGSFCTHKKALGVLEALVAEYEVVPMCSECAAGTDTRFGTAAELLGELRRLCGREALTRIVQTERLGPAEPLDALVICPCTGNTAAKIARGITDTSVSMAAKATLRADRPVLIALCSNDALGANLTSIGTLLNRKCVYFVPMAQDDPVKKPHSLVCDFALLPSALSAALEGRQLYPVFRG